VDLRRHAQWLRRTRPNYASHRGFVAALFYRLSHFAFARKHTYAARLLWQINLMMTKVDIPPESEIGPGLLLTRPIGVVIAGRVGRRATFGSWCGMGSVGKTDVGAGPGIPVVGDRVVFQDDSILLGGVHVPDDATFRTGLYVFAPSERLQEPENWEQLVRKAG
jgi:serine acetyltransferase